MKKTEDKKSRATVPLRYEIQLQPLEKQLRYTKEVHLHGPVAATNSYTDEVQLHVDPQHWNKTDTIIIKN